MSVSEQEEKEARRAYEVVGELVLIASAIDHQLNHICIALLGLVKSPMLEPLVATLDSARKAEILKAWAKKTTARDWKKALKDHAEAVEKINTSRNTAAHSVMSFQNSGVVLSSPAAAKLLKSIDLSRKVAEKIEVRQLEQAIRDAERTLGSGMKLLNRLNDVAAERDRRRKSQSREK